MSYSDQAKALMASGAAMRQETWGVNANGEPQMGIMQGNLDPAATFPCYFSGRSQEALGNDMLFRAVHDFTLRVAKTEQNFSAVIGAIVRLIAAAPDGADILVRIAEIPPAPLNPEWICGCKANW